MALVALEMGTWWRLWEPGGTRGGDRAVGGSGGTWEGDKELVGTIGVWWHSGW